jgi:hypothetical protein
MSLGIGTETDRIYGNLPQLERKTMENLPKSRKDMDSFAIKFT